MSEAYVRMGQRGTVVIPALTRRELNLEVGTRFKIRTKGKEIRMMAVEEDPYDAFLRALKSSEFGDEAWEQIQRERDEEDR